MDPATRLLALQNPDGGWGYRGGNSWTEPTACALLALEDQPQAAGAAARARAWLQRLQRPDGGWAPHPAVEQSTWVTALVVLLGMDAARQGRAIQWLLERTGEDTTLLNRVRRLLLGIRSEYSQEPPAWPWFPGTAAWVPPTAMSVLALRKVHKQQPDSRLQQRIEQARQFLFTRMCQDGGWNHGSSRALGFQIGSYPETTGLALLALHGVEQARLARSLALAERYLQECRSQEGLSWLQLGLLAHGRRPAAPEGIPERNPLETALRMLAAKAAGGRNVFLE
ncbi:MAG: prenyltransferase/squalene oxidase repeat-containing protein [Acidobacteriota bacterium]